MSTGTRTLIFRSNNLGKNSVLVLTFDDAKIPGIYHTVYPTAFKVAAFGAQGAYTSTVTYNSQLGFTKAHIDGDIVVPASTYIPIHVGQKTTLTQRGDPAIYSFSNPVNITPPTGQMIAQNSTDGRQNIGIGCFESPDFGPSEMLVFEGVDVGSSVQSEFTPILGGYITSNCTKNAVLRGQISTPQLFKENLGQLPPITYWSLQYDPSSGEYKIQRDN